MDCTCRTFECEITLLQTEQNPCKYNLTASDSIKSVIKLVSYNGSPCLSKHYNKASSLNTFKISIKHCIKAHKTPIYSLLSSEDTRLQTVRHMW